MVKRILPILFLGLSALDCTETGIKTCANHDLVAFKYTKQELYRVFTKQQFFIKGSSYPIKLVLFQANSENQSRLCAYINIAPTLLEQQLQRHDNHGAIVTRVETSQEMIARVSKYVGALGYLPEEDVLIFNNGEVIYLEVK